MYTFAQLNSNKMNYRKEHVIYTIMWIVIYLAPVMGLYMRMSGNPDIDFSWAEILNAWKFNTVWIVMFAIHNFLLAPLLILKRRTCLYTTLSMGLLMVAMLCLWLIRPSHDQDKRDRWYPGEEIIVYEDKRTDIVRQTKHDPEMRPVGPLPMMGPGEMVAILGGLLLMGMNLGVKLYFKSQEDAKVLVEIERHNLERQLKYLRYQVNPHFFMNTLNNIHALVDINPERAKSTIVELSKMMRYILYEGNNKLVALPREVQFLQNYMQLMRLRYTDRVRINVNIPDTLPELMMPPLMLIIFVENAFKHGISYRIDSFVEVTINISNDRLLFNCRNSRPPQPEEEKKDGGMGLVNVRKRLDLRFPENYKLDIKEGKDIYEVELDIPLAPNNQ